jgi:HEAT repeat protein
MPENSRHTFERLLTSAKPEEIRQGLNLVKEEIAKVGASGATPLFEMVSTIFYIDPLDRPDLVPVLDEAISIVGGFGKWIVPVLVEQLDAGDIKAQIAVAQALGRIGDEAVEPLIAAYESSEETARRSFILYALGKVKSPSVVRAVRLALEADQSSDIELRDTATRAIGKLAESIPPSLLTEDVRRGFVERLQKNLADPKPSIRAKAVRSLGKLAKFGHLNVAEKQKLKATCLLLLGKDENFEWDRAYIVRKEAEEALKDASDVAQAT